MQMDFALKASVKDKLALNSLHGILIVFGGKQVWLGFSTCY
jgi:hypothetical protein